MELSNYFSEKSEIRDCLESIKSSKLLYSIHGCSSFSATYFPENILEDKPKDQSSRWSSDSSAPPQFLVLKLQRVSIVEFITFGKFEKSHVCNLKKFKVFGGLTEDKMSELLESGLKNDANSETFTLRLKVNGFLLPCRYIKIVPLQSWGPSFNFSIWFVELKGTDDFETVHPCVSKFNAFREEEAIRVCLKHLRDYNYQEVFEYLQKKTKIYLEHPLVSELHKLLVEHGDYIAAERFMQECADAQLFRKYIFRQDYKANWTLISPEAGDPKPLPRGGHQCILDSSRKSLYLFGGWDGNQDLADFWMYDIPLNKWSLISANTEQEGGPSPRSCHKMCFDPERRQLFTLGRFVETQCRQQSDFKNDFYVYDIESNSWTLISDDTAGMGGPHLVFDHQICMDVDKHSIYVFGGRILTGTSGATEAASSRSNHFSVVMENEIGEEILNQNEPFVADVRNLIGVARSPDTQANGIAGFDSLNQSNTLQSAEMLYSGLYGYNILTNTWTQLRCDIMSTNPEYETIRSRVGHSMLFHPGLRKLFIFSGQRSREYLNDFLCYDIDTNEVEVLSDGSQDHPIRYQNVPLRGFTQRATIDPDQNEIYVFSGLSKEKEKREDSVQNSFWVYDITRRVWTCVYRNDVNEEYSWFRTQSLEPCPRFAHQLVYDNQMKTHFLFGGNPGRNKDGKLRLDDFWKLNLVRPGKDDILRQCKLMLRKLHFEELTYKNSLCALTYLQTSFSELINNDDPLQAKEIQRLALHIFSNAAKEINTWLIPDEELGTRNQVFFKRSQVFDKLARFFPEDMTQPKINLVDLVSI